MRIECVITNSRDVFDVSVFDSEQDSFGAGRLDRQRRNITFSLFVGVREKTWLLYLRVNFGRWSTNTTVRVTSGRHETSRGIIR